MWELAEKSKIFRAEENATRERGRSKGVAPTPFFRTKYDARLYRDREGESEYRGCRGIMQIYYNDVKVVY